MGYNRWIGGRMFVIEDEAHADIQGVFETRQDAMAELQRRASIPWDEAPNVAPCVSWKTCGRRYELVEIDASVTPTNELSRVPVLDVSAEGVRWR